MQANQKNIKFTTKKVDAKYGVKSGPGWGKAGVKRLTQKLALTQDEMDEDYIPPRSVSAQTVSAQKSLGFPGRNATHALALQAINSVRKDKNHSVLTAGARKHMAEIRERAGKVPANKDKKVVVMVKSTGKKIKAVKESKSTRAEAEGKKSHRFRPGTVAL